MPEFYVEIFLAMRRARPIVSVVGMRPSRATRLASASLRRLSDGLARIYVGIIEGGEKAVTLVTADKTAGALGITLVGLFEELEQAP